MTISFSSQIYVPENYTAFNNSVIKIVMKPGKESNPEDSNLTEWRVTKMTATGM